MGVSESFLEIIHCDVLYYAKKSLKCSLFQCNYHHSLLRCD